MYENGKYYNLTEEENSHRPINMDRLVTDKAKNFIKSNKDNPFFFICGLFSDACSDGIPC